MTKKTQTPQKNTTPATEETINSLSARLAEINKQPEVTGYIIRNQTDAVLNLKDTPRPAEHALLTAHATTAAQELSTLFNMGTPENILITGNDAKALCVTHSEANIAVFMEKHVDHKRVLKQILT